MTALVYVLVFCIVNVLMDVLLAFMLVRMFMFIALGARRVTNTPTFRSGMK